MGNPHHEKAIVFDDILPNGLYRRVAGPAFSGLMFKCITFDPELKEPFTHAAKRGMYFAVGMDTARCVVDNDVILDGYDSSPYAHAMLAIEEDEVNEVIKPGSLAAAQEAVTDGTIEDTEWYRYVLREQQSLHEE